MQGVIERVGYVGLSVSNLDAWEAFATNVLALQSVGRDQNGVLRLRMDEHAYRLALHEGAEDDLAYIGFEVATSADLSLLAERLERMGVVCKAGSRELAASRRVRELIQFERYDLCFEVYAGPTLMPQQPFRSPRQLDGFVTGDMGLGHVVISCDDVPDAMTLFCDGLGFRLSDVIERVENAGVHFLHCNKRHHSMALAPGKYRRMGKRLSHIMLEVASFDDVGRALDAVRLNDVPIVRTLGRHTNDLMVSFYLQTPSGFWMEYGFDGLQIDPENWTVARYEDGDIWGHRNP